MNFSKFVFGLVLLTLTVLSVPHGWCDQVAERGDEEADWGIGVSVRTAGIVFDTEDETVSSFVPQLFFDGDRFFLEGTEGGVKLVKWDKVRLDILARLRFFDIPREYQNTVQGDTVDFGARLKYSFTDNLDADLDIMTDEGSRMHGNFQMTYHVDSNRVDVWPYINIRFSGEDFNSYYYGLDQVDVDSGTGLSLGVSARYHIYKNLYAIASFESTWLDDNITESRFLDRDSVQELYLGVAFFNDKSRKEKRHLSISPYFRLAHGWATPSNIGEIISGESESDPYNNQLTSIFYGHPLTDELFGLPLSIYLTPGFVWHWESEVQDSIQEYVVAIKAYYTFTWPVKWRFGAAEGVSYVTDIPYVEASEMERKGYEPSNLMNFLDFSIDIDLGDLFNSQTLADWYLGYSIHHRSSIFESAAHFGRISGGSNYNTVYLQYHF